MDESSLRWRARIGGLKSIGLLGLIIFGVLLLITGGSLLTALNNPREPQPISIEQIVEGSIGANHYVSLDGFALYEEGYEETENGTVVDSYYLMLDEFEGFLVVVKSSIRDVDTRVSDYATLVGMTKSTGSDLRNLIRSDGTYYAEVGFVTTPDIYIAEGHKPSDPGVQAFITVLLAGGFLLSIVPFFFPTTVFIPKAVDVTADTASTARKGSAIFTTGRFLKMKKMEPKIEPGKRTQKFTNSVANIVPMQGQSLMVYIHHVVRYNFIPISKSHWGVFLAPGSVNEIQPGLKLGWTDRPAVEFRLRSKDNTPETLLVTFNNSLDQADFMNMLKEKGFRVGTGIRPLAIGY